MPSSGRGKKAEGRKMEKALGRCLSPTLPISPSPPLPLSPFLPLFYFFLPECSGAIVQWKAENELEFTPLDISDAKDLNQECSSVLYWV
ncbi:MAG: hypothetical protein EAZ73_17160 [Oscillatoriales cyanobacterium]|nr:MAG: hypothetical protein EAZ73_17160 [Oscillatoriales cyanobacterium]